MPQVAGSELQRLRRRVFSSFGAPGGAASRCRWGRFVGSRRSPLRLLAAFLPPLAGPPRRHRRRCLRAALLLPHGCGCCCTHPHSPTSDAAGATTRAPLVKAEDFSLLTAQSESLRRAASGRCPGSQAAGTPPLGCPPRKAIGRRQLLGEIIDSGQVRRSSMGNCKRPLDTADLAETTKDETSRVSAPFPRLGSGLSSRTPEPRLPAKSP